MKIQDLQREYKTYALYERGMRYQSYAAIFRSLRILQEHTQLESIRAFTTPTLRKFLTYGRTERGWTAKTFRNYWHCFKSFFGWCVRNRYLRKNPVLDIDLPKLPYLHPRCLAHEDAKRVLFESSTCQWGSQWARIRNHAIIATFFMTGVRLSELLNLEASDIDIAEAKIFVRQGKGRKDRTVPIYPKLLPTFHRYWQERQAQGKTSHWYFTGLRSNHRLYPKDIHRIFKKLSRISGVKFTPHMLRHTFARELSDNEMDVMKIKEILGHASVTTTQRYIALSQSRINREMKHINIY